MIFTETEKLYSPLFCSFLETDSGGKDKKSIPITQQTAVYHEDAIHHTMLWERLPEQGERGLMAYYRFDGGTNDSVDKKVASLWVDVEACEGKLWAVAALDLTEPLTADELADIKDFLSMQYRIGFGEGFVQRGIETDFGELHVSLWSGEDEFFIDTEREFAQRLGMETPAQAAFFSGEAHVKEPHLSPAQMALNEPGIFDEDIDCVDTSTYMSMLTDRVNANFIEYIDSLRDKYEITDYSAEIATIAEAHYYITQRHNFHFSELDYLLQFQNPLMVVTEEFDANRDEEHSDIMWKIFHEQGALQNGRHELASYTSDEPGASTVDALKQSLFDKLDKNLSDYCESLLGTDQRELIGMAEEIAARYAAREYLKTGYDFKTGEVEYLLKFQDPLALVADGWPGTLDGLVDMEDVVIDILEDRSSHGHYARVVEDSSPASKESVRDASVEKRSVLEQIREAARAPKEPHKDKPARDKSGPEL